ncbi:MAG: hypothetical protein KAS73_05345 [Candidatus Sabulitectum sp.]|nr:hypothetical protein [Candidatus Sabulitectum sp.]
MVEILKKIESLYEPDPRVTCIHTYDKTLGGYRPQIIEDYYKTASSIHVNSTVPDSVQSMIAIALNMWMYSWFYYPLNCEAGYLAIRALENALKCALNRNKGGLSGLLNDAIQNNLIKEENITRGEIPKELTDFFKKKAGSGYKEPEDTFMKDLPKSTASYRNAMAHGDLSINPYGMKDILFAVEVINQLFPVSDIDEKKIPISDL